MLLTKLIKRNNIVSNTYIAINGNVSFIFNLFVSIYFCLILVQGNAIKTFRLDRNNGTLWLRTPLDREKLDSYTFKVSNLINI